MKPASCPICTPFRATFSITIGEVHGKSSGRATLRGCKHADVLNWVPEAEFQNMILEWNKKARVEAESKIQKLNLSDCQKFGFLARLDLFLTCIACADYQYQNQTDLPNLCETCKGIGFVDPYNETQS